jgi:hypothetical protein
VVVHQAIAPTITLIAFNFFGRPRWVIGDGKQ